MNNVMPQKTGSATAIHDSTRRSICLGFAALSAAATWTAARAQGGEDAFPQKPVRFVTPAAAGSSIDSLARALGQRLAPVWKQPVVVDNVAGAGGVLGVLNLMRSPPDGYTQGVVASNLAVSPALSKPSPYDLAQDFTYLAQVASAPMILFANPAMPASNARELIAYAQHNKQLLYASAGNGSTGHLAAELLRQSTGMPLAHVPYKAVGQALTDTIGGQVQLFFAAASIGMEHVRSGRLKAIAHTGPALIPSAPTLPSFAQAGVSGVEIEAWFGVIAPAGLPPALASRSRRDLVQAVQAPQFQDYLAAQDFQFMLRTGDEFKAMVLAEAQRWSQMAKAGIIQAG